LLERRALRGLCDVVHSLLDLGLNVHEMGYSIVVDRHRLEYVADGKQKHQRVTRTPMMKFS